MDLYAQLNNIVLSDYPYQRDIDNRLLMAEFTVFDVDVLREILDGSLTTSVKQLAQHLRTTERKLLPSLKKFTAAKLISIKGDVITVDKEMRKYYESQILKFDDEFEPNMEFLKGLLSKVPIHALPNWYALPHRADHIFNGIIENYLCTPKTYERYLGHLKFDVPAMHGIMQDVFAADDFKVCAHALMKKYRLSRPKFEELMLLLEYNFVCCLGYARNKEIWEEVVTPFYEWRQYLRFLREMVPQRIKNESAISLKGQLNPDTSEALSLYRQFVKQLRVSGYTERDVREVERSIARVAKQGWIYFDDFMSGLTASIGVAEGVSLQKKGKRWEYVIPTYSAEDRAFVWVVIEGLAKAGMVTIGTHAGKPCFAVTPVGISVLGHN